jgi:hypothetical protein
MIPHRVYIERVGFSSDFDRSVGSPHLLVVGLMSSEFVKVLYVSEKQNV